MIAYKVIKKLPGMNQHLQYIKTAEEYNAVNHALYNFFNSKILTKNDYIHLVNVLLEKLPVYKLNKSLENYITTVLTYAKYNYPSSDGFEEVISGLLRSTPQMSVVILEKALYTLKKVLPTCNEFVGVEALAEGMTISLSDITQEDLETIKKILMIK